MTDEYKTLFDAEAVQQRVADLAKQISADYAGGRLLCLVVLRGGFFFAADLIRQLNGVEVELEFVKLQSYAGRQPSGHTRMLSQMPKVAGYDVLVIEDLVDTGLTLAQLHNGLKAQGPNSLRYAIVVDKKAHREVEFECEYVAFDYNGDEFLVGYGMDDHNKGRTLPYIGAASKQA